MNNIGEIYESYIILSYLYARADMSERQKLIDSFYNLYPNLRLEQDSGFLISLKQDLDNLIKMDFSKFNIQIKDNIFEHIIPFNTRTELEYLIKKLDI